MAENGLDEVVTGLRRDLALLREADGGDLEAAAKQYAKTHRKGSRFLGQGADSTLVDHVAKGGELYHLPDGTVSTVPPEARSGHSTRALGGSGLAHELKALAEGTGSSGGYLVPIEYSAEIVS